MGMTLREILDKHGEDLRIIIPWRYGIKSDEDLYYRGLIDNTWSAFKNLGSVRKAAAQKNVEEVLAYALDYIDMFVVLNVLYHEAYLTPTEFYTNILDMEPPHMDLSCYWKNKGIKGSKSHNEVRNMKCTPVGITMGCLVEAWTQTWSQGETSYFDLPTDTQTNIFVGLRETLNDLSKWGQVSYDYISETENPLDNLVLIREVADLGPYLEIKSPKDKQRPQGRSEPISISKGQDTIRDILYKNNIPFSQEYTVRIKDKTYRFDFAIYDDHGLAYMIEYDGQQHFQSVEQWGGEAGLKDTQQSDIAKTQWCKEHNIPLIRIPYTLSIIPLYQLLIKSSEYRFA